MVTKVILKRYTLPEYGPLSEEPEEAPCLVCGKALTDDDTELALCNACEEARSKQSK